MYCLILWPGCLFLSSNFSPRPLNETGNYMRPVLITWKFWIKAFGWWILMTARKAPLGTVHHEMDSMFCSHHVYKSVCSPIIGEQLVLEKEPADQSTRWIYSGSDQRQSQIEGHTPYWGKFIHRSHGILLHKGALLSIVWCLSYFWKKEERKSLEVHVNMWPDL